MSQNVLIVLGFYAISVIGNENKERERVASLIVMPPIVLGYDELYDDVSSTKKPVKKEPVKPKEIKRQATPVEIEQPVGLKRMNVPWGQLVTYEDPRDEEAIIIPQQRLIVKRTKDGKVLVPDEEWANSPKERTSQVRNVRMSEKRETRSNYHRGDYSYYKREGENAIINNGSSDKNTTLENVVEKTKTTKDNLNIGNEEIKKTKPNDTKIKDEKEDISNKNENKNITELKSINPIDSEKVVAEKITTSSANNINNVDSIVETNIMTPKVNKNIEKEEPIIETEPINRLMKKKNSQIALPGSGVISDPLSGDILNFKGNFVLPHKLFDCPCAKN